MTGVHPSILEPFPGLTAYARDVYEFVARARYPRPADGDWARAAREGCRRLASQALRVRDRVRGTDFEKRLDGIAAALLAYGRELEAAASAASLRAPYRKMARAYEDLSAQIRRAVPSTQSEALPARLKTLNIPRNLFHASMGVTGFVCYQFYLTTAQALGVLGVLFAFFGALEVTRRFSSRWNDFLVDRVFRLIARPFERHRVNSATFYLLGLLIATALFRREAVLTGVAILALADPSAMLIGVRWGRRRLIGEKTVEGTLAFLAVGFSAAAAYLLAFGPPGLSVGSRLAVALSAAVVGTVAELLSKRIDDNITIPVSCAAWVAIWL